ncbi:hypothetical protein Poli38472_013566 [Pythium oligandrum]|uniref:Sulfate transporter n=1 Tax=Pythium oligandrum TaxID=41045 RepID=A0A8K1CEJ6_PYTOL|nr:hypothetical protein Poli38472_013566 [Pythium oligandrum]|eukprot:TMW61103.1 hypothetical protein Poli38472_013566 [Pythium oligandrum]
MDAASGRPRLDDTHVILQSPAHGLRVPKPAAKMDKPCLVSTKMLVESGIQAVVTGMIIAVVLCPVMIGFVTMIYGHQEFEPVMAVLTKIIFLSSVAHQLAITFLSPLPFAIAQTQDAGLIFLSTMAASIMNQLGVAVPLEERIATVVVHLSICTALVGLGLIVLGKLRLASRVQYLPTPVIGGYLAFIGFFMVKGGISLMTGTNLTGFSSWGQLFTTHQMALLLPGVVCGFALSLITARYQHFAVFPACILLMPVGFFVALWMTGTSIEEARAYGFLSPATAPIAITDVYGLFDFSNIHWSVMFPSQLPTLFGMFIVVAFAASLDIASICMGTGCTMDYNEQLQTVGASNLFSGLTGGYTGSYIFSQTVFSFRFHPAAIEKHHPGFSRLIGFSLAACEFAIVLVPFSLTSIIPKFLFGSVMIFIGIELLKTWMIGVYAKLLTVEYVTVVATFIFLNAFGVQLGLAAGVGLAALCFLVEYSRSQTVTLVQKSSNVVRNADQHELLYGSSTARQGSLMKNQPIVTVELQGHIFFGSATRIQKRVKRAVYVYPEQTTQSERSDQRDERLPLLSTSSLVNLEGTPCTDRHRGPTRFVVIDFSHVSGLDATAARSCFLALKMLFKRHKITVVYCGMKENIEFLLRANDVFPAEDHDGELCHITSDADLALDWCEQQLILAAAKRRSLNSGRSLQAFLPSATQELSLPLVFNAYLSTERRNTPAVTQAIEDVVQQFTIQKWKPNDRIFMVGEAAESWFVLLRGQVTLYTTSATSVATGSPHFGSPSVSNLRQRRYGSNGQHQPHSQDRSSSSSDASDGSDRELVSRVRAGCIFGDMDFMLQQGRSIDAVCTEENTVTAVISRSKMEKLLQTQPQVAFVLQEVILRASYMTLAEKLHSIVI